MKKFSGCTAAVAMLAAATLAGCPTGPELHTQVVESPNSLDGTQLYFIPTDSDAKRAGFDSYARLVTTGNDTLPNQTVQQTLNFASADSTQTIALSEPVLYYGVFYNSIAVGADGTIGLGGPGGGNATLAEHFSAPQISLLPVDATAGGATVTFAETGEFVVVTFRNVTIGSTTDNEFQAEFLKIRGIDGDLALTYPQVTASAQGIVGLSNGEAAGLSETELENFVNGFVNSDLTANSNTPAMQATS